MNEQVFQINENTWCIHEGMVRCFLLAGREKALLVDTGMNIRGICAVAEELAGLPVELVNTHADPDHVGANSEFEWMYMSPAEEGNYRTFGGGTGRIVPVGEGDAIDLGGRQITVIDLPGHTPGSIGLLDGAARVLIAGDMVQTGSIVMLGRRDMHQYIASLKRLEGEWMDRFDTVWGAHGTFPLPASIVPELRESAEHVLAGDAERKECSFFGHTAVRYAWGAGSFLRDE